MQIPNFQNTQFVDRKGYLTDTWQQLLQTLFNQLQNNVGPEGLVPPMISSANNSVTPPAAGGQVAQVQVKAADGTLIWDSNTKNLKVRLDDGLFHVIVTL